MDKEDEESSEIEHLLATAEAKGYHSRIYLDEDPLKVNLLLELNPSKDLIKQPYNENNFADYVHFANTPLFSDISILLQKDIRSLLQQRLPDYMIPSELFALNQLPLTLNGKVDRLFLSQREANGIAKQLNYQQPTTEVEKILVDIWQELLGLERIGISDNFFELGGHSLLVIRLISAIRNRLEIELLAKDIFVYPTIHELAKYVKIHSNIYSLEDDPTEFEIVTL
jgi:acyl carrier protein